MAERTRHGWFCEKCWQFHDTEVETYHQIESASGAASDTDVSSPLADRTTDRIGAASDGE